MFNITKSMVLDNVTQICKVILELERQYIQWPTVEEMAIQESTFFSRYGKHEPFFMQLPRNPATRVFEH